MKQLIRNPVLQIPLFYALFGILWIVVTDFLVLQLAPDLARLAQWQTIKGWIFVILSTLIIYLLLSRTARQRRQARASQARLVQQVQQQAEQLRQIMKSVPEGVLLVDAHNHLLMANPLGRDYLRLLDGVQVGDVVHKLGDRSLDELLTSPPRGRWHELRAAERIIELIARPLEAGPAQQGWVLVLRDVTQTRSVERQLRRQERLAAIGQLAAGIAHDFNNILGAILLYSQLAERAPGLAPQDQERLATISRQANRASQLVQQILDFSRRASLERKPLDLGAMLEEQVGLLRRTVPEHIDTRLVTPAVPCIVDADLTRLQQVIMNLSLNARDAMPQGGRLIFELDRLQIAEAKKAPVPGMPAGDWIRLTVTDSGEGIAPELLDRIFEPFFTTKRTGEGTGLGLAQVHGIIRQHGGHITVHSEERVGTSFVIYLPALADADAEATPGESVATVQGQGRTLLLVEDERALRQALADILILWQFDVLQAGNGIEALQQLSQHEGKVALILSDVIMPRMGGAALVQAVRQRGWHMPIILMSGHPQQRHEAPAVLQTLDVQAQLSKPLTPTQLAQALGEALDS